MSTVRHSIGHVFPSVNEGRVDSGLVELCDFFATRRDCGESLVLGTIVRTEGSTYRKVRSNSSELLHSLGTPGRHRVLWCFTASLPGLAMVRNSVIGAAVDRRE